MIKPDVAIKIEDVTYVDERYGNYTENKKARKKMYLIANKLKHRKLLIKPISANRDAREFNTFLGFMDTIITQACCVPKELL